mgnify:CR=1 FL=1
MRSGEFWERFGEGSLGAFFGAFLERFTDSLGSPESGGPRHPGDTRRAKVNLKGPP